MNTLPTTTPNQVVAPVGQTPAIQQPASQDQTMTYNEGNGVADTIVMTGPLSEIYTRALGVYFAKKPLDGSVLASESQVLDTLRNTAISHSADVGLREIANAVTLQTPSEVIGNADATVFAVDPSQIDRPEVIDAMDRLRTRAHASGMEYVMAVVVEPLKEVPECWKGSNTGFDLAPIENPTHTGTDNAFTRATESYCASLGFPMVYGMEGLANWIIERQAHKGHVGARNVLSGSAGRKQIDYSVATEGIFGDFFKKIIGSDGKDREEQIAKAKSAAKQASDEELIEHAKTKVGKLLQSWEDKPVSLSMSFGSIKNAREAHAVIDWYLSVLNDVQHIVKTNIDNQKKILEAFKPSQVPGMDPAKENAKVIAVIKSIHQQQPALYKGMQYKKGDNKYYSLYSPFDGVELHPINYNLVPVIEFEEDWDSDDVNAKTDVVHFDIDSYAWLYGSRKDNAEHIKDVKFTSAEYKSLLEKMVELMAVVEKTETFLNEFDLETTFESVEKLLNSLTAVPDQYFQTIVKAYYRGGYRWGSYTIATNATRAVNSVQVKEKDFKVATESISEVMNNLKRWFTKNGYQKYTDDQFYYDVNPLVAWLNSHFANDAWRAKQKFGQGIDMFDEKIKHFKNISNILKWASNFHNEVKSAMIKNLKVTITHGDDLQKVAGTQLIRIDSIVLNYGKKLPVTVYGNSTLVYNPKTKLFNIDGDFKSWLPTGKLNDEQAGQVAKALLELLKQRLHLSPGEWYGGSRYDDASETLSELDDSTGQFYLDGDSGYDMFDGVSNTVTFDIIKSYINLLNDSVVGAK